MLYGLIGQIIVGIAGFWLAHNYVPNVYFKGPFLPDSWDSLFQSLIFAGAVLGLLNFFAKPILNLIALPLRILTLNLFSLVIAMFLIWLIDVFSPELIIKGIVPLFWTALIIWGLSLFFPEPKKQKILS